jgi:small subunit ribosomal protein S16
MRDGPYEAGREFGDRMLKIRLRRIGKKRTPYYRLVVAEKMTKRDGAFIDQLGSYDPHANPPSAVIDEDRTREWIRKGAQPSEAAEKVLRRVGILEAPAKPVSKVESPKAKGGAKAEAKAPKAAAEVKAEEAAAEEAPEAGEPATEAVMEAAVEGTTVEEQVEEAASESAADEPAEDK